MKKGTLEIDPRIAEIETEYAQRSAEAAARGEALTRIRKILYPPDELSQESRPQVSRREFLEAQLAESGAEEAFKRATMALEETTLRRQQIRDDIRRERLQDVDPSIRDAVKRYDAKIAEAAAEGRRLLDTLLAANAHVGLGPSPIGAADVYPFTTDPGDVRLGQTNLLFDALLGSQYQESRYEVWRASLRRDGWLA